MISERKRCWMRHRYREDFDRCPLCNAPLRWVRMWGEWTPCDREPITYKRDLEGKLLVYDGRELKDYCKLYTQGDTGSFKLGLLPHVYSCDGLNGYHGIKVTRL